MGNGKPSKKQKQAKKLNVATSTGILSLDGQKLKKVPVSVFENPKLRILNLSANRIRSVPSNLLGLKMLRTLNLSSNKLSDYKEKGVLVKCIPSDLSALIKLEKLILDRNDIAELPSKYPKTLQILTASSNKIKNVPSALYELPKLKELDLSDNELQTIGVLPTGGGKGSYLRSALFSKNKISSLPGDASCLKQLVYISLSFNNLKIIPASLFRDTKVHRMDLQGNGFDKKQLTNMEGFLEFQRRRKAVIDKGLAGGLKPNISLCGFD